MHIELKRAKGYVLYSYLEYLPLYTCPLQKYRDDIIMKISMSDLIFLKEKISCTCSWRWNWRNRSFFGGAIKWY